MIPIHIGSLHVNEIVFPVTPSTLPTCLESYLESDHCWRRSPLGCWGMGPRFTPETRLPLSRLTSTPQDPVRILVLEDSSHTSFQVETSFRCPRSPLDLVSCPFLPIRSLPDITPFDYPSVEWGTCTCDFWCQIAVLM